MKKIIISLIFISVFIFLYNLFDRISILKINNENIYSYYYEKKPIDVLFVGTSRVYRHFSPMEIWAQYGIVSYNRGNSMQYYKNTYYIIEEFIKNNKPKLIIVDTTNFETNVKIHSRQSQIKNMEFSLIKLEAYLDIFDDRVKNVLDIYTNIGEFHTRWKNIREYDFKPKTYFKGWSGDIDVFKIFPTQPMKSVEHTSFKTLQSESMHYIKKIIELANSKNIKVLFVKTPSSRSLNEKILDEQFKEYAKKNNLDFINYNDILEEINFNFNTDMKDWSHLNMYGSRKVTEHLIPHIIQKYNIPQHKHDLKYSSWNDDYVKYERFINKIEMKELSSFSKWQHLSYYDNYTMLISTNGDNVLNRLPQSMKDKFKSLGLNKFETDKKNQKYAAIIDNNNVFFEEVSDKKVEYKGRMKNLVNILVSSENRKATINVSGKPRAKNKYGINFVIYDKVNREIVDSIWVDPAKPDVVRR